MIQSFYNIPAVNLKVSPFLQEAAVLRAVNVERTQVGVWEKRSGYVSYLNNPSSARVNSLFSWTNASGSTNVYQAAGSILYHSVQGTANWAISGNGTITNGRYVGGAVSEETLIVGDGTSNTRHTTNGTGFTDTTNAAKAQYFTEYQGRIYAGRDNTLFWSTTGTPSDWTTDSSSIQIPGPGAINSVFKVADRINVSKDSGAQYRWDGANLIDLATDVAPLSGYSIGFAEGFALYSNALGLFGYGGERAELLSNPVEKYFYNSQGTPVAGTAGTALPGIVHHYNYYLSSLGTVQDDLTFRAINNAVIKYNFQLSEFSVDSYAHLPTAFGTYQDMSGDTRLIFGDATGATYQFAGTALSDAGNPINVELMGFIHGNNFLYKKWNWIRGMFNPGCAAQVQLAIADTFTPDELNWFTTEDAVDGVFEYKFENDTEGKFLFWKIAESSTKSPFRFMGWEVDFESKNRR